MLQKIMKNIHNFLVEKEDIPLHKVSKILEIVFVLNQVY